METKHRLLASFTLAGLVLAGVPALAQTIKERPLQGNPYRQVGGSCVYGRNGELLNAPQGVHCASRETEAPGTGPAVESGQRFAGLPPALRSEADALVASHAHVADDLAELRRAIAGNDKTRALELSEEVAKELLEHQNREQAFYEKLAMEHGAH